MPIWGEVELAVRSMTRAAPVLAIGGTNGKSTTTSLVGALLEAAGRRTFTGGNLGEPLADHATEAFDVVVLEVSSFQMERVDTFRPHVSALLNVTDDHLDRYASFDDYAHAKGNAFRRQTAEDWAVVLAGDATCALEARRGKGRLVTFGPGGVLDVAADAVVDRRTGDRFARSDMALTGGHNALNVAASIACVTPLGVDAATIRGVLRVFRGLPHRTALVAEIGHVRYYDDSKGTNVGAAVTALEGLVEPAAVLIAGGRDKGGSYGPLVEALTRKGRAAVVLGEAAEAIANAIGDRLPVRRAGTMDEAVRIAASLAAPGDAVLLSPACSSFDMFRDYKHRGDEFVRAVQALAGGRRSGRRAMIGSLRNVRRTVEAQLAAPLDAKPSAAGASRPVDAVLAATVVALIGFGVVMVYSASAVQATVQYHDPQFFLKRQVAYAVSSLVVLWTASRIDYHRLYRLTYPVLVVVGVLLLLCVIGFGHSGGGAARWLSVGPVHIQPAEMAKVALVIWLAYSLAKKAERVKTFTVGFLPHLIVAGVYMLLCFKQPDFGSAVVLLLLTFTMLFLAGAKVGYILGASILGAGFGAAAIRFREYRYERYLAWLHMDQHRQDLAYQPFQSVMSFGSGGPVGLGLGRGLQTLYLPEAHTDFVAAIVGEELGFVGVAALCAAYLLLVGRGVRAALRAPDDFGSFQAFGRSTMFGVQALVNLSVALAILPTKGLTLPFVSFGGSSLLVNAAAAGILLSISRHATPDETAEAPGRPADALPEGAHDATGPDAADLDFEGSSS